jgi:hypothetical protein
MNVEQKIDTNNMCNICNIKNILVECRNCSKDMCTYDSCGMHFHHINNTIYSICDICVQSISKKFIVSIDYNKLKCLKKKIKLRKMVKY